jgi:hypothetical protein
VSATIATLKRASGHAKPSTRPSKSDRDQLRLAIEAASAARKKLESRERSREQANVHIDAATEKLATVEAAVSRARESHSRKVAAALTSGKAPPGPAVMQDARDAVTEAQDQLAAAQAAAELVRAELPSLRTEIDICENAVVGKANAVLFPAIDEWLKRGRLARNEALIAQEVLFALTDDPDAAAGLRGMALGDVQRFTAMRERTAPLAGLLDEVRRFLMNIATDTDQTQAMETASRWRQARMALRSNAETALPPFR